MFKIYFLPCNQHIFLNTRQSIDVMLEHSRNCLFWKSNEHVWPNLEFQYKSCDTYSSQFD